MYDRIVVPLDGSELAERALPEAKRLARLTGASLHLVRVVDAAAMYRIAGYGLAVEAAAAVQVLDDERVAAREYLARIEGEIAGRGLPVSAETRYGTAAGEVLAAAQPGDVIVIATHGRGGVARWFLGSVAEEIARRSPMPVLLIRAQAVAPASRPPVAAQPSEER